LVIIFKSFNRFEPLNVQESPTISEMIQNYQHSALDQKRKQAEEIPAALNIMNITMIRYPAAMRGDMPDNTCPVIIPGRKTIPTAKRELILDF